MTRPACFPRQAFFDGAAGLGLAFRRLSIIDLSPQGHQPMFSATGRYVIAFNGEVCCELAAQFLALAEELEDAGSHKEGEVI